MATLQKLISDYFDAEIPKKEDQRDRSKLKENFQTGEIPEQSDFYGLIYNAISRKEDGIFKDINNPLCILSVQQGVKKDSILEVYKDTNEEAIWKLGLSNYGMTCDGLFVNNSLGCDDFFATNIEASHHISGSQIIGESKEYSPFYNIEGVIDGAIGVVGIAMDDRNNRNEVRIGLYGVSEGEFGQSFGIVGQANDSKDYGLKIGIYGFVGDKKLFNAYTENEFERKFDMDPHKGELHSIGIFGHVDGLEHRKGYEQEDWYTELAKKKIAVYGRVENDQYDDISFAGYFDGTVRINGRLEKSAGSFLIDHPLDPENKVLRHNFVESPENLCLYRGSTKIEKNGEVLVDLPIYFAALTKEEESTVLLTVEGNRGSLVSYEWSNTYESFKIYGNPDLRVSYLVIADRDDPTIRFLKKPVEEEKGNGIFQKGKYLVPKAYGKE